ncbi:MAG: Transcriptional regulator, MerR family [Deltaproteobacteria bacterium]|nr:Transcriptional regulator, MerR family [Deltaproteobacteria bacterium]
MTPFHEIKRVPGIRAIGMRADMSLWDVDTAFTRLYEKAMEGRLMFREPALGIRKGGAGVLIPDAFHSDYQVLFPLNADPEALVPGTEIVEVPEARVASFFHRGPYEWIQCTYEMVLDWLRENLYEAAGETREVFFVAPEPHAGGSQDDMLTEIQVPIREAA